ncbi:hypothetical protein J9M50_003493 [Salmonella enterica]|nr:hypothetical protein [Salmonella enterica]EHI9909931.1 hypothetical protein [Salmonella enterica]EHJ0910800.1 hypothetical protein [Salmonella enterica]
MQEQKGQSKRPILSIKHKRKPSLMYQKPPQKPDSEQKQNAAQTEQPEQAATASSTKAKPKPKYKGLPGWDEVKDRFAVRYYGRWRRGAD